MTDGAPSTQTTGRDEEFILVSFNVHGRKAGWRLRSRLVTAELARLRPDVLLLQEAATWLPQASSLARGLTATRGQHYRSITTRKRGWRGLIEGVSTITRFLVRSTTKLDPRGDGRIFQRTTLATPSGRAFDCYNVHLPNRGEHEPLRLQQARRLLAWIAARDGVPCVVAGDFNAAPDSEVVTLFSATLKSAYAAAHGAEPAFTSPSHAGPGQGRAIDYIFVSPGFEVAGCELAFLPLDDEATPQRFASDHLGLAARLALRL